MPNHAIITAAGSGKRMGAGINKIFLDLDGEPIIARTVRRFNSCDRIESIVLVTRDSDREELARVVRDRGLDKVKKIVSGGAERQDSVYQGLLALEYADRDDLVLIHNGVNPHVGADTIAACVDAARECGAAVAAFPVRDTIKESDSGGRVVRTVSRERLWHAQTPQALRYGLALRAFEKAFEDGFYGTDDVMLAERLGLPVRIVECPQDNIKITTPADLARSAIPARDSRVGFGTDSHRFAGGSEPKKLILGGVEFTGAPGLEANSDGDVVLHALFNAISQALGERSIGHYADPLCAGGVSDSAAYIGVIMKIMEERGYEVGNIGVMIEGSRPRIAGNEERMKNRIGELTGTGPDRVGITATTGEGLTDFGRGLGVQCSCTVMLNRKIQ